MSLTYTYDEILTDDDYAKPHVEVGIEGPKHSQRMIGSFVHPHRSPYSGLGAQLRGTGRRRSLRHQSSMQNTTTDRLERAVPRQLQRLVGRRSRPTI